jgi:hypothetical protein
LAKKLRSELFVHGPSPDYGKTVPVPIKSTKGEPVTITLTDGTELQIRLVVFEVKRSLNRHSPDGNPVYAVSAANAVNAKIPSRLKLVAAPKKPRKR